MMERIQNAGNLPSEKEILEKAADVCPVQWAVAVCKQAHADSCGKGVFCREGLKELYLIAEDITNNRGTMDDIELLQLLTKQIMLGADCDAAYEGARLMKLSIDTHYDDWTAHVLRKRCKAGQCTAFPKPTVMGLGGLDLGGTAPTRRRAKAAPAEEPAAPTTTRRRRNAGAVVVEEEKPAVTAAPVFNVPDETEEAVPAMHTAAPLVDLPAGGRRRRREKKVEIVEE